MSDRPTISVIGAGIVGVCCALHLQNEGFEVTLLDRGRPGDGASSGNLGGFGNDLEAIATERGVADDHSTSTGLLEQVRSVPRQPIGVHGLAEPRPVRHVNEAVANRKRLGQDACLPSVFRGVRRSHKVLLTS